MVGHTESTRKQNFSGKPQNIFQTLVFYIVISTSVLHSANLSIEQTLYKNKFLSRNYPVFWTAYTCRFELSLPLSWLPYSSENLLLIWVYCLLSVVPKPWRLACSVLDRPIHHQLKVPGMSEFIAIIIRSIEVWIKKKKLSKLLIAVGSLFPNFPISRILAMSILAFPPLIFDHLLCPEKTTQDVCRFLRCQTTFFPRLDCGVGKFKAVMDDWKDIIFEGSQSLLVCCVENLNNPVVRAISIMMNDGASLA